MLSSKVDWKGLFLSVVEWSGRVSRDGGTCGMDGSRRLPLSPGMDYKARFEHSVGVFANGSATGGVDTF